MTRVTSSSSPCAGLFGTFNDAWRAPIAEYGPEGEDAGRGGKYLLVPPGDDNQVADDFIVLRPETFNVYSWARLIPASSSPDDVAVAVALTKQIKTYPYTTGGSLRETRHIDMAGRLYDGIARYDATFYDELATMINEEPVAERDLVAMALANSIGITKGEPFAPDPERSAVLASAIDKAHNELMDSVTNVSKIWPSGQWDVPGGAFGPHTEFTFRDGDTYSTDERGSAFFHGCAPPKKVGAATMYIVTARDAGGDLLDGSATYRLTVPPDVPARQYWAVTVYDLGTCSFLTEASKSSVDSYAALDTNPDGSVDIYFAAQPPGDINEANWVYVADGQPFHLAFRFYGPEPGARDGRWILNDLEKLIA